MTETLVVLVIAFVLIAGSAVVGPRLGIAAPLLLVAIGVAASFLPVFGSTHIEPDVILEGVLPPLLYSSAVSMPSMNFRREFGAISGLSVVLVVASALVLGVFFMLALPNLGFAWGVAIGAIVSPTDAVATSIIRQTSVSRRVVSMLEGESLLNDATALVLLRSAIVATSSAFSVWGAIGSFGYSVVVASIIGWVVGWLNLMVRRRITDPAVNTVLSFAVPFVASVPANLLGASGLVAAVVAGLVTGIRSPRDLSPQNRLSDAQNWRTVELVLEGAVFLTMGVQLKSIVTHVQHDHGGVGTAVLIAAGAAALTVVVRAAFVAPLLAILAARSRRNVRVQPRFNDLREKLNTPEGKQETLDQMNQRGPGKRTEQDLERFANRLTRGLANIQYFLREPLGWREGTAVVWAGMRGAVTVAAAQTLPDDTPQRSTLVLIAFAVAAFSLLGQGGSIGPLLRAITPEVDQAAVERRSSEERERIWTLLRESAESVPPLTPPDDDRPVQESFIRSRDHQLAVIGAQRAALLDARDNGTFDADVLESLLANLDSSQIAIEMRGTVAN